MKCGTIPIHKRSPDTD